MLTCPGFAGINVGARIGLSEKSGNPGQVSEDDPLAVSSLD